MVSIYCHVCKRYIEVSSVKEFRESGHYQDVQMSHLPEPNVGKSMKRHSEAVRKHKEATNNA
jgi:hypothetical protein